jgi:ubiquilin
MPEITLNIKLVNAKKLSLLIDSTTVVSSLKANVEQLFQVPVAQQKLVFRGRILKNDQTISSYEIQNDSLVVLLKVKPPLPAEAAHTASQSVPQQFQQNPFQQHQNNPAMNVNISLIMIVSF